MNISTDFTRTRFVVIVADCGGCNVKNAHHVLWENENGTAKCQICFHCTPHVVHFG